MAFTYTTDIEFSEEDGVSFPVALIGSISANDDNETITFKGVKGRIYKHPGTVGDFRIPLFRLGYANDSSLTVASLNASLYVQIGTARRELVATPISATAPGKPAVTTNFILSGWDPEDGFTFDEATPVDAGTGTITNYIIRDDALGWQTSVAVGDLPADLPFAPDNVPLWPQADNSFDASITVAAQNEIGIIGPASDAVSKTIAPTNSFYVSNSEWTATSVESEGPAGLIDIDLDSGSGFALLAPWDELRCFVSDETITLSDLSVENTAIIEVGDVVRLQSGVAVGEDAHAGLCMRRSDTGQFFICSTEKTVEVLALSVTVPTVVNQPQITGLVSHSGTLKADIDVALSGGMAAADWSGETSYTNQFRKGPGVAAGSEASNALAAYTPVEADNGNQIWVLSKATASGGGQAQRITAIYDVVWPVPVAIGTIPTLSFTVGDGTQTISAATVAAKFTGSGRNYSLAGNDLGATINSSTGEISVPDPGAATSSSLTVQCSNSGGVAQLAPFSVVVSAVADTFTFSIGAAQWTAEEAPEADGKPEGTVKITVGAITVPDGYGMRASCNKGTLLDVSGMTSDQKLTATMGASSNTVTYFTKAVFAVGDVVKVTIFRRRFSDEEYRAADTKTVTIQGYDVGSPGTELEFAL